MPGGRADNAEYTERVNPGADRAPGHGTATRPARVSTTRTVSAQFVYDRHAAADTSAAYAILLPPRQARTRRVDNTNGRTRPDDQHGDLRPGVLGPAEERRDDRLPDRGVTRPRRAAGT